MLPIIAQVRDRTLARQGILSDEDLVGLKLFPARNAIGTWTLELPHMVRDAGRWVPHTMAQALSQPGAGIVVELPGGRRFSGPVVTPSYEESTALSRGKWTFTGVSDAIILADRRSFPDPTIADAQASSNSRAYDTRTGPAESLMHAYVDANIGPSASVGRRDLRLAMGPDMGRGATRPKSARFPTLLELCQELAASDDLLFDVVQEDGALRFVTWTPVDRTADVHMDVQADTLDSAKYAYSGPAASRVIVLGQGEAEERVIRTRTTTDAATLEADWGRVIETTVDQRNAEDVTELDAKGDEVLAANAIQVTSLDVTPSDVNARALGTVWWVGDRVTVNVAGQPVKAAIASVRVEITAEGLVAGATVGDAVGFDVERTRDARTSGVEARVSSLERTAEASTPKPTSGPAALRDSVWGVPVGTPQQVALANARPVWFNTDTGWQESFYAPDGASGLSARGLVAGTAAGWYPTGRGPRLTYAPTGAHTTPGSGAVVTGWDGSTWRNGAGWFSYASGEFTMANAGRYRISMVIGLINGAGVADFHHYAGGQQRNVAAGLYANQFRLAQNTFEDIVLPAGATSRVNFMTTNPLDIFVGTGTGAPYRGEFAIEYLGPALVSD